MAKIFFPYLNRNMDNLGDTNTYFNLYGIYLRKREDVRAKGWNLIAPSCEFAKIDKIVGECEESSVHRVEFLVSDSRSAYVLLSIPHRFSPLHATTRF